MKSSANIIGKALFANLTDSSDSEEVCLSKNSKEGTKDPNSFITKTIVRTSAVKEPRKNTIIDITNEAEFSDQLKKETDMNTS